MFSTHGPCKVEILYEQTYLIAGKVFNLIGYHLYQETEYNTRPSNGSGGQGKNANERPNRRSEASKA